ncbi:hypothetical protein PHAMO_200002 [Magnetospirillum molischianum DSM 120]|uniref:Uncharacterized protein n=1 Tax=Magnetospirillum molischianum DSM 120 TaxID=1150626 RepID=H8FPX9_MAGML|nr:hypothetical protein PHAMO_200002 [Magnetospirillum molischianum DSM 120]
MFRARWTDLIHDEWIRNLLVNRPDLTRVQLERVRDLMNTHSRDVIAHGVGKRACAEARNMGQPMNEVSDPLPPE